MPGSAVTADGLAHEHIADLVVAERLSQEGKVRVAYTVPTPEADLPALRRWIERRLAGGARPAIASFVDRLPRSCDGEVDISALERLPVLDGDAVRRCDAAVAQHVQSSAASGDARYRVTLALGETPPMDSVELRADTSARVVQSAQPDVPAGSALEARRVAHVLAPALERLDDLPGSLPDALETAARVAPERGIWTYNEEGERELRRYPELLVSARNFANGLRSAGVTRNSIVLLQTPSLGLYFEAFWACLLVGALPVTLASPDIYDAKSPVLDKTFNAWAVAGQPLVLSHGTAAEGLRNAARLYAAESIEIVDLATLSGDASEADLPQPEAPRDGAVALLQLSSGSTGRPKLIQITHHGVIAYAAGCQQATGIGGEHVTVNWLPLDHVGGLVMFHLRDVLLAATQVHLPTASVIGDPLRWLDALELHGAQHTWAPNFGYRLVKEALADAEHRSWDLSSIQTMLNGGEQCTLSVVEGFLAATRRFGVRPEHVLLSWGMAETCTAIAYKLFGERGAVRTPAGSSNAFLSVGRPAPGSEMRIVDPQGRARREGEVGHLQVRSIRITPGYLGDRDPTAFKADGWFDTGDLAFIEDDHLTITGRTKEVIVINGANVACHDVEEAAMTVKGVTPGLVAACGVPNRDTGSEGLAVFFVPSFPATRRDDEVVRDLATAVARDIGTVPSTVVPVEEANFPRTTSGKIQRGELREAWLQGRLRAAPISQDPVVPDALFRLEFSPVKRKRLGRRWLGRTLVFADRQGASAQLAGCLPELAGPDSTRVFIGTGFSCENGAYTLRPREHSDWRALAAALEGEELHSVLFLWSYDATHEPSALPYHEPDAGDCALGYLLMAQFLMARDFCGEVLSASRAMHGILGSERGSQDPATTSALAMSLHREAPQIDAWHADLPGSTPKDDAGALCELLARRRTERDLAWREDQMWASGLRRVSLTSSTTTTGEAFIREGGCYVATGALGGVGVETLEALLEACPVRLLVIGLGSLSGEEAAASQRRANLTRLERVCEEVRYVRCAAQDALALRAAVEEAERDWNTKLDGAFHFAGGYDFVPLEALDVAEWSRQVAGKVEGLVNLATLLHERGGADLLSVSSVISRLGGTGSAAYAAANRFVEGYSDALNRTTTVRVHCLSWGGWRETGMNAGNLYGAAAERSGVLMIDRAAGRALVRWAVEQIPGVRLAGLDSRHLRVRSAITDAPPRAVEEILVEMDPGLRKNLSPLTVHDQWGTPVPVRFTQLQATAANNAATTIHGGVGRNGHIADTNTSDRAGRHTNDSLAGKVAEIFARQLNAEVPRDRPFYELGLDSIQLIRVRKQLETALGVKVDPTALFEFPTVETLSQHLVTLTNAVAPTPRRSSASERADAGDIAVVGVALRLPDARSVGAYWENLRSGRCSIKRFTESELREAHVPDQLAADPDFVPVSGALEGLELFDPEKFGMSRREALLTAPQHRLLLEVAHELLADAGCLGGEETGRIGVFAGTGMNLYAMHTYLLNNVLGTVQLDDPITALQVAIGNEPDFAATRIAYQLDLRGPAVNVQTACSTSLVALHMARLAIKSGDCDAAVVGAGAIHMPQATGYVAREGSILSPTGVCRAFDARADGTVGGNGVAAILVKGLRQALADGDEIQAVVRASAVNNDGANKVGFTAPSLHGQAAVVTAALRAANVPADTIRYVQAHGTGTPIGDPIEVQALTRAFMPSWRSRDQCVLGSVKPNIGHLDSCAGLAGLIAAILTLRRAEAPPQINYLSPNPALKLEDSPFRIVQEPTTLHRTSGPLRVAVSALGVGGTNAHAILEEPV